MGNACSLKALACQNAQIEVAVTQSERRELRNYFWTAQLTAGLALAFKAGASKGVLCRRLIPNHSEAAIARGADEVAVFRAIGRRDMACGKGPGSGVRPQLGEQGARGSGVCRDCVGVRVREHPSKGDRVKRNVVSQYPGAGTTRGPQRKLREAQRSSFPTPVNERHLERPMRSRSHPLRCSTCNCRRNERFPASAIVRARDRGANTPQAPAS